MRTDLGEELLETLKNPIVFPNREPDAPPGEA